MTHRKGKTQGYPISPSSFDNIISPTMKKADKNNQNVNHDSSHKDFISPEKIREDETTSYGAYIRKIWKSL